MSNSTIATGRPIYAALLEFLVHGVKYAFPPKRGALNRGMRTGYAAPPLNKVLERNATSQSAMLTPGARTTRPQALTARSDKCSRSGTFVVSPGPPRPLGFGAMHVQRVARALRVPVGPALRRVLLSNSSCCRRAASAARVQASGPARGRAKRSWAAANRPRSGHSPKVR